MNPLAAPLYELMTAIWNDPKYREARDKAMVAHAEHAHDQMQILREGEKLAPILMQMAIAGFTPEDYEALQKAIAPKVKPLLDRRKKEQRAAMQANLLASHQSQLDAYKAKMDAYSRLVGDAGVLKYEAPENLKKPRWLFW